MVMQTQTMNSLIQANNWYVKNRDLLSLGLHFESNGMHRAGICAVILQTDLVYRLTGFFEIQFIRSIISP